MRGRESSWEAGAISQAGGSLTGSQIFLEHGLRWVLGAAAQADQAVFSVMVTTGQLGACREAVGLGQILLPGCSRRGGEGQDGGDGSCPVWPSSR